MIIAIADDITGAAEIAGVGWRFGMQVKITTEVEHPPGGCDLMVYATNSRSMTREEAVAVHTRLARNIEASGCRNLFKKTDSALRGYIIEELQPLLRLTKTDTVLFIPQNPSKERVINEGIYTIAGKPIHQTSFKDDPEFPARTSKVVELLNGEVHLLADSQSPFTKGIHIANASSLAEVEAYAARLDENTLPAGGADFFTSRLKTLGFTEQENLQKFDGLGDKCALIVCGSTVKHSLSEYPYIRRKGVRLCPMPQTVFEGKETPLGWFEELKERYREQHSLIIAIGHPPKGGKAFADRLKCTLTEATLLLLSEKAPDELIIEGGATAYSILQSMKCNSFTVDEEIAPGVIRLAPDTLPELRIILKPGSYPWGKRVLG